MSMSEEEILAIVRTVLCWTGAGVCWILSIWTIVATIFEVAKGKSRPYDKDVIVGVLFHGFMAIAVLKLANMAIHGG